MEYYNGYGYGPVMGWGGTWIAPVFAILFLIVVIICIVALVRWIVGGGHRLWWRDYYRRDGFGRPHDAGHAALDVLKERYAKGEIDKQKFEEMKKDLEE